MIDILNLSTSEIYKIQYDILATTTKDNNYIEGSDKKLKTNNKAFLNAINEIYDKNLDIKENLDKITNSILNIIRGTKSKDELEIILNSINDSDNIIDAINELYKMIKDKNIGSTNNEEILGIKRELINIKSTLNNLIGSNANFRKEEWFVGTDELKLAFIPDDDTLQFFINGINYPVNGYFRKENTTDGKVKFIWISDEFDLESTDVILIRYYYQSLLSV